VTDARGVLRVLGYLVLVVAIVSLAATAFLATQPDPGFTDASPPYEANTTIEDVDGNHGVSMTWMDARDTQFVAENVTVNLSYSRADENETEVDHLLWLYDEKYGVVRDVQNVSITVPSNESVYTTVELAEPTHVGNYTVTLRTKSGEPLLDKNISVVESRNTTKQGMETST
jgi:hypothetical protein